MNGQEKSPKARGSCKHSHSPSPSAESVGHKWKEVCTEDTFTLNSTLTVSSSTFDGLCSPMGSHSNVTELLPPSITLTPLGLGGSSSGKICLMKVGTHWLQFIPTQASTFQDTLQQDPATLLPLSPAGWIPPHVEYLAHRHVHLWAILSPPDY